MSRLPALLNVYRTGVAVLEPAVIGLLYWRRRQGREERTRMGERQGYPSRSRPPGPLAWVHGASNGETLSLLPLVERLTQRGFSVLVTSGTRTSATLIARRLPPGAFHQFMPVDVPRYVRRFLDYWQPNLVLVAESEIWPNMVLELERRQIPLILVNGRMSDRSYRRWHNLPRTISALLDRFSLVVAQTHDDAERFARLGAPRVVVAGNLKYDAPPPPADARVVAHLSGLIAGRPVWLAASTHAGEEEVVIAVHRALATRHPNLLTLIVPRHPHRGPEVASLAEHSGLRAARRSTGMHPDRATDVYVADTIGELGLFYRLSSIVLLGGSLVPSGGHNPIEPAKLGAAILHGPHTHNASEVFDILDEADGAICVEDSPALAKALHELLSNPARTREIARACGEAVQTLGGAVERTLQSIEPFVVDVKLGARR